MFQIFELALVLMTVYKSNGHDSKIQTEYNSIKEKVVQVFYLSFYFSMTTDYIIDRPKDTNVGEQEKGHYHFPSTISIFVNVHDF